MKTVSVAIFEHKLPYTAQNRLKHWASLTNCAFSRSSTKSFSYVPTKFTQKKFPPRKKKALCSASSDKVPPEPSGWDGERDDEDETAWKFPSSSTLSASLDWEWTTDTEEVEQEELPCLVENSTEKILVPGCPQRKTFQATGLLQQALKNDGKLVLMIAEKPPEASEVDLQATTRRPPTPLRAEGGGSYATVVRVHPLEPLTKAAKTVSTPRTTVGFKRQGRPRGGHMAGGGVKPWWAGKESTWKVEVPCLVFPLYRAKVQGVAPAAGDQVFPRALVSSLADTQVCGVSAKTALKHFPQGPGTGAPQGGGVPSPSLPVQDQVEGNQVETERIREQQTDSLAALMAMEARSKEVREKLQTFSELLTRYRKIAPSDLASSPSTREPVYRPPPYGALHSALKTPVEVALHWVETQDFPPDRTTTSSPSPGGESENEVSQTPAELLKIVERLSFAAFQIDEVTEESNDDEIVMMQSRALELMDTGRRLELATLYLDKKIQFLTVRLSLKSLETPEASAEF